MRHAYPLPEPSRAAPRRPWMLALACGVVGWLSAIAPPAFAEPPAPPATAAAAPIDADGAYRHVLTFEPARTTQPEPLEGPVRGLAFGQDGEGGAVVLGGSEVLAFDRHGNLRRDRFAGVTLAFAAMDQVVPRGDAIFVCNAQDKSIWRLADDGAARLGDKLGLSPSCALFANGTGFVARQGWPPIALHVDAQGRKGERMMLEQGFVEAHRDKPLVPCGQLPGGAPIAIRALPGRAGIEAVALGPDMRAARTLLRYPAVANDPHRRWVLGSRVDAAQQCSFAGGRFAASLPTQVFVFDDKGLLSALRGGAPIGGERAAAPAGDPPYGFQIASAALLLGEGELLLVAERDRGLFSLYALGPAPAGTAALARARKLAATGEAIRAEQAFLAHLDGAPRDCKVWTEREQNLLRAGYWDALQPEARDVGGTRVPPAACESATREARDAALAALLARYAGRVAQYQGQPPLVIPAQSVAPAATRAAELAERRPDLAEAQVAAMRLGRAAAKPAVARAAMGRLVALVRSGKARAADHPEVIDALARAGDRAALDTAVGALPASDQSPRARRWRAMALRLKGEPKAALAALGPQDTELANAMLRARLLGDLDQDDAALQAWQAIIQGPGRSVAEAHAGHGGAALARGLTELAIQSYLEAIRLDPDEPTWRANLAVAYRRLDQRERAMGALFEALGKAPQDGLLRARLQAWSQSTARGPAPGRGYGMMGAGAGRGGGPQADGSVRAGAARPAPAPPALAVIAFREIGSTVERAGLGTMLATMLQTAIVEQELATVVERDRIDALIAEQKLQRGRGFDRGSAVQLGKLLGAKRVLLGQVAGFSDKVAIDVKLVDVQTGKVLSATSADSALELEPLRKGLSEAAQRLLVVR